MALTVHRTSEMVTTDSSYRRLSTDLRADPFFIIVCRPYSHVLFRSMSCYEKTKRLIYDRHWRASTPVFLCVYVYNFILYSLPYYFGRFTLFLYSHDYLKMAPIASLLISAQSAKVIRLVFTSRSTEISLPK